MPPRQLAVDLFEISVERLATRILYLRKHGRIGSIAFRAPHMRNGGMNAGCQKANERENPRFRYGVCRPKSKSFSKIRQDRGVLGQRLPVIEDQRRHSALRIDL